MEKNLVVRDPKGNLPYEDAVLDFSNPAAVEWYQDKLANLLKMGVGAIKVDFGEAAPANGLYASGRTGFYEHNLYPLRYNKAVADITKKVTGENIIWARSAWAGSQRYPLHWGGDAESTNGGMAAELRGGLSFGLCGFSFWSHDVGGFVSRASDDLYLRWLAFGVLTSHTRCHGTSPKEPWEYGQAVMDQFRAHRGAEVPAHALYLRPGQGLIGARACPCCGPCSWNFRTIPARGRWTTNTSSAPTSWSRRCWKKSPGTATSTCRREPGSTTRPASLYAGGWHRIEAGKIPVVMLVRDGTVLPHIALAQSTQKMDWSKMDLAVFAKNMTGGQRPGLPAVRQQARGGHPGQKGRGLPPGSQIRWTVRSHLRCRRTFLQLGRGVPKPYPATRLRCKNAPATKEMS